MKSEAIQKATSDVETIVKECGVLALREQPAFMQAINLARGMSALRSVLHDDFVREVFMPLQGTPLGFLTDKDQGGGYPVQVVRDCLIEALLRGFRPVGNEYNIIAGRFYGAKAGFERIVTQWPGVSDLQIDIGVPTVGDKGALVPMEANWLFHGERQGISCRHVKDGDSVIDTRIPVRVNSGMGPDAIIGKATRKLYARIYQRLTGCSAQVIDGEVDDMPAVELPPPAEPSQDGRRISMKGKKNGSTEAAEAEQQPRTRQPGED